MPGVWTKVSWGGLWPYKIGVYLIPNIRREIRGVPVDCHRFTQKEFSQGRSARGSPKGPES